MNWNDLPEWAQYLTRGLLLFSLMSLSAVVLSRAGKSSYWALFTVIPYFAVVAIWVFAFARWPKIDETSH